MKIVSLPIDSLKFDRENARKHSGKNLSAIKGSLTAFGQQKPIVVDKNMTVVAGNGTLAAAKELGWAEINVVKTDLEPELAKAFALADNRTSELAEWDDEILKASLSELDLAGFDIGDLGFDAKEFDFLSTEPGLGDRIDYTKKIEAPIYEPKGDKPLCRELVDTSKMSALIKSIDKLNLSQEEKFFLHFAAYRHNVFDYEKIAEYYAHSSKEVQQLFEESALVIIDFNKAIESGFVKVTKQISETYKDAAAS